MKWSRRMRVFNPLQHSALWTHAMMPKAKILCESRGLVEVIFGRRDLENRSHIHRLVLEVEKRQVLDLSVDSILQPGAIGAFDDAGVSPGSLMERDGTDFLYYTGWNRTLGVPFNNSIGLARREGAKFVRLGHGPILTRSLHEPFSVASPSVLPRDDGYVMWYSSMDEWQQLTGKLRHKYDIKVAFSADGVEWEQSGLRAITYANNSEYAFGCSSVLVDNGTHYMWYPYRGVNYRIGFATSVDGLEWFRQDFSPLALDPDPDSDWDSDMVCYPSVFLLGGTLFMLYNGNGYGLTGFGIAELEGKFDPR